MTATSLPIVTDMLFSADEASILDIADRIARIMNEVGIELGKVADLMAKADRPKKRERAAAEMTRAISLLLHCTPCVRRLEAIAMEKVPAWNTPDGGPSAAFDQWWPDGSYHD